MDAHYRKSKKTLVKITDNAYWRLWKWKICHKKDNEHNQIFSKKICLNRVVKITVLHIQPIWLCTGDCYYLKQCFSIALCAWFLVYLAMVKSLCNQRTCLMAWHWTILIGTHGRRILCWFSFTCPGKYKLRRGVNHFKISVRKRPKIAKMRKSLPVKISYIDFILITTRCRHSKNLQPEWEKLAQTLEQKKQYVLGRANCEESGKSLCDRFNISMYPDIRLYRHGKFQESYDGERTAGKSCMFFQSK